MPVPPQLTIAFPRRARDGAPRRRWVAWAAATALVAGLGVPGAVALAGGDADQPAADGAAAAGGPADGADRSGAAGAADAAERGSGTTAGAATGDGPGGSGSASGDGAVAAGGGPGSGGSDIDPAATASEPVYGVSVRRNLPITMEDGVVLRGNVYSPTDPATGEPAEGPFPVVLIETAYGKDLAGYAGGFTALLGNPDYFTKRGYIAAIVDVRGTGSSQGQWSFNHPQEARDSVRVVEWAAALPRSNGKVGMTGASYLGITQLFAAAEVGPDSPLKAIFPMIASNSIFRDAVLPGGLLDLEGVAAYLSLTAATNTLNPLIAADPATILSPLLDHAAGLLDFHVGATADVLLGGAKAEDGAYWRARGPERALSRIVENGIPAYLVGGFDDIFQAGVFRNYVGLQNAVAGRETTLAMQPGQRVSGRYQALVGPWFHATIGTLHVDLEALTLTWFDRWLKGVDNGIEDTDTPLHVVQRDDTRRDLREWPVPDAPARAWELAAGGRLVADAPDGSTSLLWTGLSLPCQRTTEMYALGMLELVAKKLGFSQPCADSSLQPSLPGPLSRTFTTEPVSRATTIAGPINAQVTLSSTTRDAQVVAKVYDVAPSGKAVEISTGALLASHRAVDEEKSWRSPDGLVLYPHHPITHAAKKPLTPGRATTLDVMVPPVVHTLAPGHRLRLVLATGELPAYLPLPGDLLNLVGGIYRVQLGGATPSRLVVPVLAD
ncbi:CocE/NonD family hydrolase [Nocardioides sp. J54]|uniref:CocE/NonD family hydrolase n=1 Tax=Nocardioides sp. J54 TaxID=935866 RepID=UPI0012FC62A4|nr:CocE/NonD family hydrolase [Nocardioides sp. J54]